MKVSSKADVIAELNRTFLLSVHAKILKMRYNVLIKSKTISQFSQKGLIFPQKTKNSQLGLTIPLLTVLNIFLINHESLRKLENSSSHNRSIKKTITLHFSTVLLYSVGM